MLWKTSGTILFQRSLRTQDAIRFSGWIGSRSVTIIVNAQSTHIVGSSTGVAGIFPAVCAVLLLDQVLRRAVVLVDILLAVRCAVVLLFQVLRPAVVFMDFCSVVCCAVLLLCQVLLRPAVGQASTVVDHPPSPDRSLARREAAFGRLRRSPAVARSPVTALVEIRRPWGRFNDMCELLFFYCCCVLGISGLYDLPLDYVCLIWALDVKMSSWFDLLLLCTNHAHIYRDHWHNVTS